MVIHQGESCSRGKIRKYGYQYSATLNTTSSKPKPAPDPWSRPVANGIAYSATAPIARVPAIANRPTGHFDRDAARTTNPMMQTANNIGKASPRSCSLAIEDGRQTRSTSIARTRPLAIQTLTRLLSMSVGFSDRCGKPNHKDAHQLRNRQYRVWQMYAHRDRKLGHCHQCCAEKATDFGKKVFRTNARQSDK